MISGVLKMENSGMESPALNVMMLVEPVLSLLITVSVVKPQPLLLPLMKPILL
jgi:hypothetical protein